MEEEEKKIIYSCNYPVTANLSTIDLDEQEENEPKTGENENQDDATPQSSNSYTLHLGETQIYQGRVYLYSASQEQIQVDISPICREYLEPLYEKIDFNNPTNNIRQKNAIVIDCPTLGNLTTIGEFTLTPSNGIITPQIYTVMYNYNTDYKSEYELTGILSNPLLLEAHPQQYLTLSAYNLTGKNTYSYTINNQTPVSLTADTSKVFQLYIVNLKQLAVQPGDKITLTCNNQNTEPYAKYTYTIVDSMPNQYVLYYVNKSGGLDNLFFRGKHIESFKSSSISTNLYSNRSDRQHFQKRRLSQEISKKYQLNTSILEDDITARIDELLSSPKVWIHHLDNQTVNSCLIEETSYTIKNFHNNKIVTYQINVTEGQDYLRK